MAYEPWEKNKIPPSYQKITWEDRKERTARDYGVPEYIERGLEHPNRKYLEWVHQMGMNPGDWELLTRDEQNTLLELEELTK